jgi:hypothetical protein
MFLNRAERENAGKLPFRQQEQPFARDYVFAIRAKTFRKI